MTMRSDPDDLEPGSLWQALRVPVSDPMTCPHCKRTISPQPIAYGLPGIGAREAAERGDIALGGCIVSSGSPSHRCRECGFQFGGRGEPLETSY